MQMLPSERDPIAERDGRVSLPWRAWFDDLRRQVESDGGSASDVAADIEAICRALGSPDGTPENIPDNAGTGAVIGQKSIRSFGQLSDGRVLLTLANDADAPGATYCYGTDAAGVKGWFPISDALAASANITLTVGADGVTTPDLADLSDSGTGTALVKITRDAKGRISGTEAATTDDLAEGANLYYTDTRADARIAAQKGVAGGLATLDASSKLDSGQLPALAITETFVVADEAAMLALTCEQGDVAVRTDISTSFILTAEPASTLSNWQELLSPTAGAVTSFNGRTGAVVPASGDYTAAQVGADPAGTAAAIVTQTIAAGDTTHAPSANAVAEALDAIKLQTSMVNVSAGITVPTDTPTALAFDTVAQDDVGAWDAGNPTRLTCPAAGQYRVLFSVRFQAAGGGNRTAYAQKNGADYAGRPAQRIVATGAVDYISSSSPALYCAAGDYFELYALQDSGGNVVVSSASEGTWFALERIR